jgi:tRNA dimethylallyltransferase
VSESPPLVAVVGPTASGKSAVAMSVAEELGDVELISADSMQVYRGMDIGTAKPTTDERRRVRHHLIDVVAPDHDFTVAEFQARFRATAQDVAGRDRRAILVGGTGLYHRAVVDDLEIPGEWPAVRERLHEELAALGPRALHERLAEIDPVAAARMQPTNDRRIVRALEVCEGSGRPFSSFGPGLDHYPTGRIAQIGLRWDRQALAERIERRVRAMVRDGLVEEVAGLSAGVGFSRTAAQALGYREILAHLDGEVGLDDAVEQIVVRTRQFAVRQLRWFQRDPRVEWVDVVADPVTEAGPVVARALGG